jgi:asparagine N-glycosylation enzyme membrane subunit Stt3
VNESWSTCARYLARYRGALLGGIGSAVAVAMTLDPSTGLASSGIRFAFWFAMVATLLAIGLTCALEIAEYRASRPTLPRAVVRRR